MRIEPNNPPSLSMTPQQPNPLVIAEKFKEEIAVFAEHCNELDLNHMENFAASIVKLFNLSRNAQQC